MIDAHGGDSALFEWPGQPPILHVGGVPVFEVWFHDSVSDLWFAMTATPHAPTGPSSRGGIGFHPLLGQEGLRTLVESWRTYVRERTDRTTRH
jgi:hypothetical protein